MQPKILQVELSHLLLLPCPPSLLQLKFMRTQVAAGEAVGVLAAQSVGECHTKECHPCSLLPTSAVPAS